MTYTANRQTAFSLILFLSISLLLSSFLCLSHSVASLVFLWRHQNSSTRVWPHPTSEPATDHTAVLKLEWEVLFAPLVQFACLGPAALFCWKRGTELNSGKVTELQLQERERERDCIWVCVWCYWHIDVFFTDWGCRSCSFKGELDFPRLGRYEERQLRETNNSIVGSNGCPLLGWP